METSWHPGTGPTATQTHTGSRLSGRGAQADARGRVGNGLAALDCTKGNLAPQPPAQGRPAPAPPPASPREPARAPAAQPRSRGSTRTPHIYAAAPSALTPVPLSHTTTFLPWLSMVRPGEPPPGLACFLLHEAPPSALRSAQAGSPRPAAAPSERRLAAEKANENRPAPARLLAALASGPAPGVRGGGPVPGVSALRARPGWLSPGLAGDGAQVCRGARWSSRLGSPKATWSSRGGMCHRS